MLAGYVRRLWFGGQASNWTGWGQTIQFESNLTGMGMTQAASLKPPQLRAVELSQPANGLVCRKKKKKEKEKKGRSDCTWGRVYTTA